MRPALAILCLVATAALVVSATLIATWPRALGKTRARGFLLNGLTALAAITIWLKLCPGRLWGPAGHARTSLVAGPGLKLDACTLRSPGPHDPRRPPHPATRPRPATAPMIRELVLTRRPSQRLTLQPYA